MSARAAELDALVVDVELAFGNLLRQPSSDAARATAFETLTRLRAWRQREAAERTLIAAQAPAGADPRPAPPPTAFEAEQSGRWGYRD
ncbi:MAG: hypothetical protein AB7N54_20105 [Alphaproteobacteria bacterium]